MPQPDPRKFPPSKVVQLLNSFPTGTVLSESKLRRHRMEAGFQISSDGETVDILKYIAWLCHRRHTSPKPKEESSAFGDFVQKERESVRKVLEGLK